MWRKFTEYYIKCSGNKNILVCVDKNMVGEKWYKIEVGTCVDISLFFGITNEQHFDITKDG